MDCLCEGVHRTGDLMILDPAKAPRLITEDDRAGRMRGIWRWWALGIIVCGLGAVLFIVLRVDAPRPFTEVAVEAGWRYTTDLPRLAYKYIQAHPDAPTLLFVHGGPGDNSAYLMGPLAARLGERYNLCWYDQRGTGKSERDVAYADYSLADHVEDIRRVQEAIGMERVVLVAHSWGGIPAGLYAARYPEKVTAFININGAGSFREIGEHMLQHLKDYYRRQPDKLAAIKAIEQLPRGFEHFIRRAKMAREAGLYYKDYAKTQAEIVRYLQDAVRSGEYTEAEVAESEDALLLPMMYHSLDTVEIYGTLGKVTSPTLVMAGTYDKVVDPPSLRRYARAIPNAEFVLFEQSGHHPFQEEPERFDQVVHEFLQRVLR